MKDILQKISMYIRLIIVESNQLFALLVSEKHLLSITNHYLKIHVFPKTKIGLETRVYCQPYQVLIL
jgi:hypothetical protein